MLTWTVGTDKTEGQADRRTDAGDNNNPSAEEAAGPRLNIKTVLSTYGDFHVKDKTAVRTSYL